MITFIRLNNMYKYVVSVAPSRFNETNLKIFLIFNTETILIIKNMNAIFGNALFAYVMGSCPSNTMILMMVMFTQLNLIVGVILALIFFAQVFYGLNVSFPALHLCF